MKINRVAVIGSGVMGAGIAAHLANAGVPSLLLDLVPQSATNRNQLALQAIEEIKKSKPSLIFSPNDTKWITPGNLEDDLSKIKECEWVVEVVVERLDIKQQVFSKIEQNVKPGTLVSSNTSGLPLQSMAEGRSKEFKKNFMVTHFFNPVRYMKLVEVVSSPETDPKSLSALVDFLENTLGKGIVYAKDTPNFIANRIGLFSWMAALKDAINYGLTVEEVDKIGGPALGRPKSAAFRTADMSGLDTIVQVAKNTYENCPGDEQREVFKIPQVLESLIQKKWLGSKTGQGFYKKVANPDGTSDILSLDLRTVEYKPQQKVRYDSLGAAKNIDEVGPRIKVLVHADDKAGQCAWKNVSDTLVYAANRIPEIADDIVNVDNAIKWGFNWQLGIFETWDALGVKETADRLKKEERKIPTLVEQVLSKDGVFYKQDNGKRFFFDLQSSTYKPMPEKTNHLVLRRLKNSGHGIKSNSGASLIDLGDGVLCVEFHSKMNAIDADIGTMVNDALDLLDRDNQYIGLVFGNDGENFSAGANLMLLWMEAQQKNWKNIETLVASFQDACMRLKYSKKPVVVAPFGMALGGGCEISMACNAARMYGELYMGLVEVGAGLIPGGGGNKMLLLNIEEALKGRGIKGWAGLSDGGPFPKVQKAFETIAFAKVSMSCKEAVAHHYMKKSDRISLSRDSLLYDAKQDVLEYSKNFIPPKPREDILVPGNGGKMALLNAIENFKTQGIISDHDALIGSKLAHVLTAGDLPTQGYVSEQYLLDIEREAFISLCGEEKSQARMQHLLMKGKPLRN